MSNAFTNAWASAWSSAWSWSIRRSPLLGLWRSLRGMGRPNRDAFALLDAAALPEPVEQLIRTTITRTKLWRDEREQIARELIAHAKDALDAGRSPEHIAQTFGDPRRVARLLRRSMKRKRPFVWQAYRFSKRAVGVMVLLLFVGYGVLAVRFYAGEPNIKTDYMALLDARNIQYTQQQRSWGVIAEVGHQWDREFYRLSRAYQSMNTFPAIKPGEEGYDDLVETVRAMEPMLEELRLVSRRPIIGAPMGYEVEQIHEEGVSWTVGIIPVEPGEYKDQSIIGALLPQLSWISRLSILLSFDAHLAIEEGDTERAVDNLLSVAHFARQCSKEPYLISALTTIGMNARYGAQIEQILRDHPGVFSEQQLIELVHANALTAVTKLNLHTERTLFEDLLQRIYTDDGDGNGRMTPEGAELLLDTASLYGREANPIQPDYQAIESAAMPVMLLTMNDRASERAIYDSAIGRIEEVLEQGPRAIGWLQYEETMSALRAEQRSPAFSPAELATPALSKLVQRVFQHEMNQQAVSTMLAIEVYRDLHGSLPDSLDELPTGLLPKPPGDLFDPGATLRYIKGEHGGFVLYSVGADGDDDGGMEPNRDINKVNHLLLRYPFKIIKDENGKPKVELDSTGKPVLSDPQGPDGDWILIDTRPQPEPDPEPAGDA